MSRQESNKCRRILIVEDDDGLRKLIVTRLSTAGYELTVAADGQSALQAVQTALPDALLLDQCLSDMTGIQLLKALAESGKKIPFIVMTGEGDGRLAVTMMKLGAADYLIKDTEFIDILPLAVERLFKSIEAERQLLESEQHFRTLANGGSALIWTTGTDKLCNYFNEPWLRFTGRSLEQELGNGWSDGVHPEDFDRCIEIFTSHFERLEPFSMEYRLRHATGDYRWILDEGNPRYDSEGRFLGYIGYCYDITARRRVEEDAARQVSGRIQRLEILKELAAQGDLTDRDAYDRIVDATVNLTDSTFGYLYFYDEDSELFTLHAWSRQVMPACTVIEPKTRYSLDQTGFWGEPVRQRRHIINNDFAEHHELKKGYPEGHAPLTRFMSVPVFVGGRIVAVVGVANRAEPYSDEDAINLQDFSQTVWALIQQRIEKQQAIEEHARYHALSEASFGGVIIHEQGLILECNDGLTGITGYSHQELVGMNGLELIAPESLDTVLANIRSGFDQRYEVTGLRRDGSRYPLAIKGKDISYRGRDVRVIEFRDIAEQKQREDELSRSRELVQSLLDSVGEAIYGVDLTGGCTFSNQVCQDLLGYSEGELTNRNMHDLIHHTHADGRPHPVEECVLYRVFRSGEPATLANEVLWRADGTPFPAEIRSYPFFHADRLVGAVVSFRDMTESLQQEYKTFMLRRMASLGEMATGVAHEINNPITGIINCAQLLKNRLPAGNSCLDIVERISREGTRIAKIVKSLLTITHPGLNRRERVCLSACMETVMTLCQAKLVKSGIDLEVALPDDLPAIDGEPQMIEQLLLNLLSNAHYALNERYPERHQEKRLRVSAAMKPVTKGDRVCLFVEDQGTGVRPEHLGKLFDPFFTTKPAGVGTGLGLGLCHEIVRRHHGEIRVESEFGKFTRVTVELPTAIITASDQV